MMSNEVDATAIQELMDNEYARWQADSNMSIEDFYGTCATPASRAAVILGNMNYQVDNGGWSQWVFNGYANAARPYIRQILDLIDTENARVVRRMITKVYTEMSWNDYDDNHDYNFDELDAEYYAMSDAFFGDVVLYIEGLK